VRPVQPVRHQRQVRLGRAESAISTAAAGGTVLITGATGFIGRRLTAALLAQHRRVIVLTRDRLAARAQLGPTPLIVERLDELPDETRVEAIVNLAGAMVAGGLWTKARRRVLTASRVETTRALVAFAARLATPPRVLVNGSAVGFYGDRGGALLDEGDPRGAGFMADLCAGWEAAAFEAQSLGVRVAALRLGLVFDWSGGLLPMLALTARFGLAARIGDGRQWAPWVHRDDVVRLVLAAIDNPAWQGPINAVAPDLVTQGELTRRLAAHLRRPQFLAAPAGPMRLALGELSDLFLASQRVIPSAALDLGFVFSRPTLETAFEHRDAPLRLIAPKPAAATAAGRVALAPERV
jgi:hypothetical protein